MLTVRSSEILDLLANLEGRASGKLDRSVKADEGRGSGFRVSSSEAAVGKSPDGGGSDLSAHPSEAAPADVALRHWGRPSILT
jgi:hypothetical protein